MDINKLGSIDLLLVEDDADFSYSLNSRLKKRKFNVTAVASAEEALQILNSLEFDVVVTDIKLQGLDGFALLEKIKEINAYLPVILITGYASLNSAREAVKLNAFDYLLKPFDRIEDILNPIYKAVYSYRLERENLRLFDSLWSKMYELERSRQKYQDLFDSAGDVIYTVDINGIFTSVNKKMEEITQYKSEELLGKPDSMFILSVNDGSFKAKSKNILGGALYETVDVKIKNRDGHVKFGELGMRPIREGDEVAGMQCIFRDMTERKRSEEEIKRLKEYYEDIVLSVPNAILTINKSLEIESANKTFYSMFRKGKDDVLGKNIADVFDKFVNDKVIDFVYFNENNENLVHFEWNSRNITEHIFYAEISLCRTFLAKQEYILMVITDITGLRRAEHDKKEMQSHFFQMQKTEALGQLAAGVAHEFNNVLSIILGHAQLSLEEESQDEIRNSLQKIEQVTKRGSSIVKKLSAYAKPQKPFFVDGSITQVIDEVIKLEERQFHFENISIEKEYRSPSRVSFDFGLIEQVLLNLMINAAHAIRPKGRGTISIIAEDAGDSVEIRFSDNGIGMEEEIQAKVFDPFFTTRVSNSEDNLDRSGTGLGLSISHTIIKQHGGDIRVESEKGIGTTFIISLPAIGIKPAAEHVRGPLKAELNMDRIKELRILLVDDEDDMISLMKSLFERVGFESVFTAQSGRQALLAFEEIKPDVVFLDIVMPDMSGYQVFEEIRLKDSSLPVVFTTGKIDINDDETIKKHLGGKNNYDIIQKPFSMNDILAALSNIVKNIGQKV